jgi:arsenate reductase (thioredoxin)
MNTRRVLFLCTGNSARSQMAEGLTRQVHGDRWEAHSAGTDPADAVHPLAVQAMAELGIDISSQRPKSVSAFRDQAFDLVVTVCDNAYQSCPFWLGQGTLVHVSFPDPAAAQGTNAERLEAFRRIRDLLLLDLVVQLDALAPASNKAQAVA